MVTLCLWLSIPVTCDRDIPGIAQPKDKLGKAIGVLVAQIELAAAVDPNRIDPVIIPIPHHRLISRQSIVESNIREARVVGVLQENHAVAGPEDARRILAIPIPVTGNTYIAWIAELEAYLGCPGSVGIAQIECSIPI